MYSSPADEVMSVADKLTAYIAFNSGKIERCLGIQANKPGKPANIWGNTTKRTCRVAIPLV